jgi:hypothetical protein
MMAIKNLKSGGAKVVFSTLSSKVRSKVRKLSRVSDTFKALYLLNEGFGVKKGTHPAETKNIGFLLCFF